MDNSGHSQVRIPKPEIRKKSEIRNPKVHDEGFLRALVHPPFSPPETRGFRPSIFGVLSAFGLRLSNFTFTRVCLSSERFSSATYKVSISPPFGRLLTSSATTGLHSLSNAKR